MPVTSTVFDLGQIIRDWRGVRICSMKEPLERGLLALTSKVADHCAASLIIVTEFDYDGPLTEIVAIEPIVDVSAVDDAVSRVEAELQSRLGKHLAWSILTRDALPFQQLPHTRAILPGRYPKHVYGVAAGRPELYEKLYVRAAIVESAVPSDLIADVLALDGLQDELVDYIVGLGHE